MTARTRTSTSVRRALAARPSARIAAGIAVTAATGAIAVTAAAPWASAATTPAAHAELTSAVKPAQAAPVDLVGRLAAHPATTTSHATATPAAKHATAAHAAAKHATAKHATAKHATARHSTAAKPSTIYDSVTASSIPAGADAAVYADGSYQASTAEVAGHKHVLWIDTNGSRPDANVLDVEPGDATPAGAATWVHAKLTADPNATAIVYTFKSDWAPTTAAINALPASMKSHVKYWIADPTGTPHILPGAAATQWYWGASYDISSAAAGFSS